MDNLISIVNLKLINTIYCICESVFPRDNQCDYMCKASPIKTDMKRRQVNKLFEVCFV